MRFAGTLFFVLRRKKGGACRNRGNFFLAPARERAARAQADFFRELFPRELFLAARAGTR